MRAVTDVGMQTQKTFRTSTAGSTKPNAILRQARANILIESCLKSSCGATVACPMHKADRARKIKGSEDRVR